MFHPDESEALQNLTKVLNSGYAGQPYPLWNMSMEKEIEKCPSVYVHGKGNLKIFMVCDTYVHVSGCVHFTSSNQCDIKVLILLYSAKENRKAYIGFIPNEQGPFVDRIR